MPQRILYLHFCLLLNTTVPHYTFQSSYVSVDNPSSSMWPSSRTCPTWQSFIDSSGPVTYVQNQIPSTDMNVFLIDGSVHRLVAVLDIPSTNSLRPLFLSPVSFTATSSQVRWFKRCLTFLIDYIVSVSNNLLLVSACSFWQYPPWSSLTIKHCNTLATRVYGLVFNKSGPFT